MSHNLANHQPGQFFSAGLGGRRACDHAPAPQHGYSIGDRHRFGELVRDQHHDSALGAQVPQQIQERAQLRRREHAGRLVENQHARIEAERAQNFEPDALGDRTILDGGAAAATGILASRRARAPSTRPRRDRAAAAGVEATERQIFLPREPLEQHRALMHRRDSRPPAPRAASPPAAARHRGATTPQSGAIGRRSRSSGWSCPRRFPDQRVNLAGTRLEVDAVERERAAEALGYGDCAEQPQAAIRW